VEDPVTLRALELLGFANKGLTVYLRHDLPLGSGFGISGASALAACMELEKNLDLCVKAAHQAEVEFRTGLGDVIAIAESIHTNIFPSIVIRQTPGYGGETQSFPIGEKFAVCISGVGRDTSEIITDEKWIEIINSAALGIQISKPNIRSSIKIGRLFTEKSGLVNDNISHILDEMPIGSVSSVAHLGTSIVATSEDMTTLVEKLSEFGKVRLY
jgi:pantoate kinase